MTRKILILKIRFRSDVEPFRVFPRGPKSLSRNDHTKRTSVFFLFLFFFLILSCAASSNDPSFGPAPRPHRVVPSRSVSVLSFAPSPAVYLPRYLANSRPVYPSLYFSLSVFFPPPSLLFPSLSHTPSVFVVHRLHFSPSYFFQPSRSFFLPSLRPTRGGEGVGTPHRTLKHTRELLFLLRRNGSSRPASRCGAFIRIKLPSR